MLLSSPRVPPVSIEEMAAIDAELGRRREPGRTPLNISARRAELIYRGRAAAPPAQRGTAGASDGASAVPGGRTRANETPRIESTGSAAISAIPGV